MASECNWLLISADAIFTKSTARAVQCTEKLSAPPPLPLSINLWLVGVRHKYLFILLAARKINASVTHTHTHTKCMYIDFYAVVEDSRETKYYTYLALSFIGLSLFWPGDIYWQIYDYNDDDDERAAPEPTHLLLAQYVHIYNSDKTKLLCSIEQRVYIINTAIVFSIFHWKKKNSLK